MPEIPRLELPEVTQRQADEVIGLTYDVGPAAKNRDIDLSNVPAAFTFVLRGQPCVFDLKDITFRGPDD